MAKKISQLTQATQVKSDDVTVIVQDGETKKLPLNMMVTKQDIENKKVAGLAKLDEIEVTYENDTYTPTIAVKNKSSVKVGEGDGVDYSANVMDGHVKSAILLGNTLVNLLTKSNIKITSSKSSVIDYVYQLDTTKTYIIQYCINQLPELSDTSESGRAFKFEWYDGGLSKGHKNIYNKEAVVKRNTYIKIEPFSDNVSRTNFSVWCPNYTSGTLDIDIMIIEYQEGMENWDIPYFEGMQSVQMPGLTTVGKNLFNLNEAKLKSVNNIFNTTLIDNGVKVDIITSGSWYEYISGHYIPVKGNTKYKQHYENTGALSDFKNFDPLIVELDKDKNVINRLYGEDTRRTFTTSQKTCFIKLDFRFRDTTPTGTGYIKNIQFEEATESTPYEPYKTNILTVNEDVTLRSNGSVYDELDLLTGKLTQRIDENGEVLAQDVVKTVDLIPSGTHPSTTPYCWKDGHIQLSSSGLLPSLEYSVVTSRAGQISQNAAMIVKNDKRIFDLEILLAGGLVNTTYQALTLQNQVETGLSKVSLSSEKEPDYLLYHMIMKLIDEKAYKLDDLAEKVSVFYLYEKLSDEQFETIYAALYPFAEDEYFESDIPGDDEVIEEPIVDESLEEVEDEVVM